MEKIMWLALRAVRRHSGPIVLGLAMLLLLVGGGFGPPLLGIVVGLLAMRIASSNTRPVGALAATSLAVWSARAKDRALAVAPTSRPYHPSLRRSHP